jgi:isoleucyl-tRNA synthetase
VTIAFKLIHEPEASVLAWTTTPWTLPSNLALCVHPDFTYLKIQDEATSNIYYINEKLLTTLYPKIKTAKYKKLGQVLGKDMLGWRYEPLFPYFADKVSISYSLKG